MTNTHDPVVRAPLESAGAFTISARHTVIHAKPADCRALFEKQSCLVFDGAWDVEFLEKLMAMAGRAQFSHNLVENLGTREIETPQRVGASISLLFGRHGWLDWLEAATGLQPLRAAAGRLVQTRPNGADGLDWHDDMDADRRMLGLVVNLSDGPYSGGAFELRRVGEEKPFLSITYNRPGTIMLFAVSPALEHRVTAVTGGRPRRVYAGWVLSQAEHAGDILARRPSN